MFDKNVRLAPTPTGGYRLEIHDGGWIPFIELTDRMIDKIVSEQERILKDRAALEGLAP